MVAIGRSAIKELDRAIRIEMKFMLANEVAKSLELQGHWFVLGHEEKELAKGMQNFPGIMRFKADESAKLSIIGCCGDDYLLNHKKVPVITGRCCSCSSEQGMSNVWVSIFDAWGGSYGDLTCPAIMKSDFAFSEMWIGGSPFCQKSDVSFNSVSFAINNLEHLLFSNHFHSNWDPASKKIAIDCTLPKSIVLFEDQDVRVSISFNCEGGSWSLVQLDAALHEYVRVEIQSLKGCLPYYGRVKSYEYYIDVISSFLGILVFTRPYVYDVRGILTEATEIPKCFYRRWRRSLPRISDSSRSYVKCLFPIISDGIDYQNVVKEYFRKYNQIKHDVGTLIEHKLGTQTLTIKSLADLVFAFEGLSNHLFKTENAQYVEAIRDNQDHKKMRDAILALCNDEQKLWINGRLDINATLAMKLRVAVQKLNGLFPLLSKQSVASKLVSYYRDSRNTSAHSLSRADLNIEFYVSTVEWFVLFIAVLILERMSLDVSIIKNCLKEWEHALEGLEKTIENGLA